MRAWGQPPSAVRPSKARRGVAVLSVPQLTQTPRSLIQGGILFAERKPYLLRPIPRIIVKTRSRNRRHANLLDQILRELHIIREPKRTDIGHDVIRTTRTKAPESRFRQSRHQPVPPRFVSVGEIFIISSRQPQSRR